MSVHYFNLMESVVFFYVLTLKASQVTVVVKSPACPCRRCKRRRCDPWTWMITWKRAAHSSILAWWIPWTEKPSGLQSIGLQSWTRLKWLNIHTHTGFETKLTLNDFSVQLFRFFIAKLNLFLFYKVASFVAKYSVDLEKEMATHSSILAWRMPGTEEPGGLPSMGSDRVRHYWSGLAAAAAAAFCWFFGESVCLKKISIFFSKQCDISDFFLMRKINSDNSVCSLNTVDDFHCIL